MTRAWSGDAGLETDSVTRKGKNADGQDTFFVQAGAGRSTALTTGFPLKREQLYVYDALVIANVEGDFFTRAQLGMAADFVSERGGGLLVLGGRSFTQRGLSGTPLEEALPVELSDRRGGLVRTSLGAGNLPAHNKLTLTPEGEGHPIMRMGGSLEETRKSWSALPALAASATLGGPRPGATVLALTTAPGGGVYPIVAVQRYGQGRSMIFAGEASWRWKMLVPSTDRTYEFFWRQTARWLSSTAPDPVAIALPDAPEPGDTISIDVTARDDAFAPVTDAIVDSHRDDAGRRHAADQAAPRRRRQRPLYSGAHSGARRSVSHSGRCTPRYDDARHGGPVDVCRRRGSRVRRPAPERRIPAACRAQFWRPVRACRRGVARSRLAAVDRAAERRTRTSRRVARAVGVCDRHCAALRGVDAAPALGASMRTRIAWVVACLLACLLSGRTAAAGERYALIVTGASGGDAYAQKYAKWRVAFVATLRDKFAYAPDRMFVLAESESDGVEKATRENVQKRLGELRRRVTKDDQLLVLLIGHGTSLDGDEAKFNLVART